jgi:hypothetical protein
MTEASDPERTLDDLAGFDIRLNAPGGAHFEGRLDGDGHFVPADGTPAPGHGRYEISFRAPGRTAWMNDARLEFLEL